MTIRSDDLSRRHRRRRFAKMDSLAARNIRCKSFDVVNEQLAWNNWLAL